MRDRDVREALRANLRAEHASDPSTVVIEELGLCERTSRIDVAVVNGSLNGFEIKSARDTLERLPAQARVYSSIFDTVTIVSDSHHLCGVRRLVPMWWGITKARLIGGRVELDPVRKARPNPHVDPYALAQLLWRDEALAALDTRNVSDGVRTKRREAIWLRLAETLTLPELGTLVRETLKTRRGWRDRATGQFQ